MSAIQQVMLGGGGGTTLKDALTAAALTTNLKLCLDAGDSSSYNPSVQTDKWLDVAGSGYDFYRGTGTGADAADPTFNGSSGYSGSYWSFDGGDYFTYDTTNEAWMQTLHQNNAVFSLVAFYYQDGAGDVIIFLDTSGFSQVTGIRVSVNSGSDLEFLVRNSSALALEVISDASPSNGAWHMVGLSINEATGAGGGFLYIDGSYSQVSSSNTFTSTYSSPSAGDASNAMRIAGSPGASAGQRLNGLAVWQGTALTKANMDTIWAAMRGRFGI